MRMNAISSQLNITKNVNKYDRPTKQQDSSAGSVSSLNQRWELKKQLRGTNNSSNNMPANSVLDSSMSYVDSLRASRTNSKNTTLEKKKLKYSYKAISSKIVNCKKSYVAKEVVGQAKREVTRLKKLRSKEEYNSEELEAAIAHAQAMERVAKKKARHLEEEEMVKAAGGACMGELEEREDTEEVSDEELDTEELENLSDEELDELAAEADMEGIDFEEIDFEEIVSSDQIDAMMSDMLSEMSEEMSSLMEDMGLDELFDDMEMTVDKDMDPADYKMMVIKHRNKEMKEMTEADGEYLKAIFDMLAKQKASAGATIRTGAPSGDVNVSSSGLAMPQIANVPTANAPIAGIDISL